MVKSKCKKCGRHGRARLLRGGMWNQDEQDTHLGALLAELSDIRLNQELVDMVIEFTNSSTKIPLHTLVAASNSGFLRLALRAAWDGSGGASGGVGVWKGRPVRSVTLSPDAVSESAVHKLVDYWYTGALPKSESLRDLFDVWVAGDFLQVWKGVSKLCLEQVKPFYSLPNWITLLEIHSRFEAQPGLGLDVLKNVTHIVAGRRFQEVVSDPSWVTTPLFAVTSLLSSKELPMLSDDLAVRAAVAWIQANKATEDDALSLLQALRITLPRASAEALQALEKNLPPSAACRQLVKVAMEQQKQQEEASSPTHSSILFLPELHPFDKRDKALLFNASTSVLSEIGLVGRYWVHWEAAVEYEGWLYMWTGYSLHRQLLRDGGDGTTFETLMKHENEEKLSERSAAFLDGYLYITGGQKDVYSEEGGEYSVSVYTVERYSIEHKTLEQVTSMKLSRSKHVLVVVGGYLYALGGLESGHIGGGERYDPAKNAWTEIAEMKNRYYESFAAAALDGCLYVSGGHNQKTALKTCEMYDPRTNTWSAIADLPEPRLGHAMACLNGSLYVFGGFEPASSSLYDQGNRSTSPPWRYDPGARMWVEVSLAPGSLPMVSFDSEDPLAVIH